MRTWLLGLVAAVVAAGCASTPPTPDPNLSDPPAGPYAARRPRYGTETGVILGAAGRIGSSVGAQMLRDDDTLFGSGKHKKALGGAVAGVGGALLAGALVDALTHDKRNHLFETMRESGAIRRAAEPRDVPPNYYEWLGRNGE